MTVLIVLPSYGAMAKEEYALLKLRGYDNGTRVCTGEDARSEALLAVGCAIHYKRLLVLHPHTPPAVIGLIMDLSNLLGEPYLMLDELPAIAPASKEALWPAMQVAQNKPAAPVAPDRPASAARRAMQWLARCEQRINRFLGSGLKNPQSLAALRQAQQPTPVEYKVPNTITTTGDNT